MFIDFNIHDGAAYGVKLPLDLKLEKSFFHTLPDGMRSVAGKRRQEYIAGRYCAMKAAEFLGYEILKLPSASTREPVWPQGVVGSITHSKELAISCVSVSKQLLSIGIDAEELIKYSMAKEIEQFIANDSELDLLHDIDFQLGITIIFSAKESLYKALFPITRTFLDFKEIELVGIDFDKATFELKLKIENPALAIQGGKYNGSFKVLGETIVTIVTIPKIVKEGNNVNP